MALMLRRSCEDPVFFYFFSANFLRISCVFLRIPCVFRKRVRTPEPPSPLETRKLGKKSHVPLPLRVQAGISLHILSILSEDIPKRFGILCRIALIGINCMILPETRTAAFSPRFRRISASFLFPFSFFSYSSPIFFLIFPRRIKLLVIA